MPEEHDVLVHMGDGTRYHTLSQHLRETFGCKVYKVSVDAGFTCPTRDGTKGVGGCIYCDARGSGAYHIRGQPLEEQIQRGMAFARKRHGSDKFIVYFQAFTNTYAPIDKLRSVYEQALSFPDVVGLAIGTRPDCVPNAVLDLIADYARKFYVWMEYGLQSAKDETLEAVQRGHTVADFVEAVHRTKARGIWVCVHVMLGLPGEDTQDMMATADLVAELDLDGIKIHPTYVPRGTVLEEMYRDGSFGPLDRSTYVARACDVLERIPERIIVHRITGEAPEDVLVAPKWCLDKVGVLQAIRAELVRRDTWQGKRCRRRIPDGSRASHTRSKKLWGSRNPGPRNGSCCGTCC